MQYVRRWWEPVFRSRSKFAGVWCYLHTPSSADICRQVILSSFERPGRASCSAWRTPGNRPDPILRESFCTLQRQKHWNFATAGRNELSVGSCLSQPLMNPHIGSPNSLSRLCDNSRDFCEKEPPAPHIACFPSNQALIHTATRELQTSCSLHTCARCP